MIVSSVRARVVNDTPAALEWAKDIASFVHKRTGIEVQALLRVGATQDVVWLQRFPDLATYEKSQEAVQGDPTYWTRIKEAQSKGFFDTPTVEAGIWRQL